MLLKRQQDRHAQDRLTSDTEIRRLRSRIQELNESLNTGSVPVASGPCASCATRDSAFKQLQVTMEKLEEERSLASTDCLSLQKRRCHSLEAESSLQARCHSLERLVRTLEGRLADTRSQLLKEASRSSTAAPGAMEFAASANGDNTVTVGKTAPPPPRC